MASPTIPVMLMVSGLLVCAIAVRALRLVMASWQRRIEDARGKTLGHVVWRPFDTFAVALWCVFYALGGVSLLAGLFVLAP